MNLKFSSFVCHIKDKLNANRDLIILPDFWINVYNADSYYKGGTNRFVLHTTKPYAEFTIYRTYKLNFLMFHQKYFIKRLK